MRWTLLYARSRGVPFGLLLSVACAAAVLALSHIGPAPDLWWGVFLLLLVAAVLSSGLEGQDQQLDRTAAVRWQPRRMVHLLLIGVVSATVVLTLGDAYGSPVIVLRDAAGMVGLVGATTVILGAQFAWTVPLTWCMVALLLPDGAGTGYGIGAWMIQSVDVPAANWTAVLIGGVGVLGYTVRGPRVRYGLDKG